MARAGRGLWVAWACAVVGCGGGAGDDDTLREDPAVERGCRASAPAAGQTRAKYVECSEEIPRGRLASARLGDVILESSRARFVIRQLGEGHFLLGSGGGQPIDATLTGGEDVLKEIIPLFALNAGDYKELVIVDAGGAGPAEVVVRGPMLRPPVLAATIGGRPIDGILEQHYILAPDESRLLIRTVIRAGTGKVPSGGVADVVFLGGDARVFLPGSGFEHEGAGTGEYLASQGLGVSYAMVYQPAMQIGVRVLDTGGILGVLGPDARAGHPVERWLVVGDGSVAALTDQARELIGSPSGVLAGNLGAAAAGVPVLISDVAMRPLTVARADAGGSFSVRLPPGPVDVRIDAADRAPGQGVSATITAGATTMVAPLLPAQGLLALTVHDDLGAPSPARLTLTGAAQRTLYLGPSAPAHPVPLPPGSYHVAVSRGMEWSLAEADVTITAGQTTTQALTLTRLLDTAGWVAADFHLHSEMSTDSTMPLPERIRACSAEGLEYVVSTDHDFIASYDDLIDELGLPLSAASGEELSSVVWGHLNAWPLVAQPAKSGAGAVRWDDRSPGQVFDALREGDAMRVIQVNHPRFGGGSLFDVIDFDPLTARARRDPGALGLPATTNLNDFDFDAVEVANGIGDEDFEEQLGDWLALVHSGHPAAATGASDSHGPSALAGVPRTYVFVGAGNDTTPTMLDDRLIARAIKERRVMASGGAFVTFTVARPGGGVASIGDTVTDSDGEIEVAIQVQAPPYLALRAVRVMVGASTTMVTLDQSNRSVLRYAATLRLPVSGDSAVVVLADPASDGDPVIGKRIPSLANPILIDADGDGLFAPRLGP